MIFLQNQRSISPLKHCVWVMCLCVGMHTRVLTEVRGIESPGAEVTGSWELPPPLFPPTNPCLLQFCLGKGRSLMSSNKTINGWSSLWPLRFQLHKPFLQQIFFCLNWISFIWQLRHYKASSRVPGQPQKKKKKPNCKTKELYLQTNSDVKKHRKLYTTLAFTWRELCDRHGVIYEV